MVVVEGDANSECPVLQKWMQLPGVVERAAKGSICLCRHEQLDRATVADNHQVLIPLIMEYGASKASGFSDHRFRTS